MKTFIYLSLAFIFLITAVPAHASYRFSGYVGKPPIHVSATTGTVPKGITPSQIKSIYNIPADGGKGTIVIIGAYNAVSIEKDLQVFDAKFNLPLCTSSNGCFSKHLFNPKTATTTTGWALETALDVEWAHAIAPAAKILLVEAPTPSGANLLKAIDYAASQKDASAISMSWGGSEFPEETSLDSHFASVSGAQFFASAGDSGTGASWPAASPNVIAVGGTTIILTKAGALAKEVAWTKSGGGVSIYEKAPPFQVTYSIPKAKGMRAIPDVAYDADPVSGFPIVHDGIWRTVGGTSAGAPQWAAIAAVGKGVSDANFYADKSTAKNASFFRDIVSGANGSCGYYCDARARYDYVTGLGTPLTVNF